MPGMWRLAWCCQGPAPNCIIHRLELKKWRRSSWWWWWGEVRRGDERRKRREATATAAWWREKVCSSRERDT